MAEKVPDWVQEHSPRLVCCYADEEKEEVVVMGSLCEEVMFLHLKVSGSDSHLQQKMIQESLWEVEYRQIVKLTIA